MKAIKKFIRFIYALFRKFFKFLDKKVVTPLTKVVMNISELLGKRSGRFERWLVKRNTLIFLSLILALIVFFAVDNKAVTLVDASADVLYDQKVEAIYNSESYVVEGLPETVDVTLIGRSVDMYLAKQLSTGVVSVDLSNLKEGTHKVKLNYESVINSVDYKLDPSVVTINIYPKLSKSKIATIDAINSDVLDSKLSVNSIETDQQEIIIKGSEKMINQVATVKILVDLSKLVDPSVGVMELKDVPLVAYDSTGGIVNVEMVPSKVSVKVSIASPSKEVPIKVIPVGEVLFGKAISSVESSVSKVTVYGKQDVLDGLEYIPVEVSVKNLKSNKTTDVKIEKPTGITYISQSNTKVTVTLGDVIEKEIPDVMIETINLDSSYRAAAIGASFIKTTVVVSGTKEVLDNITADNIRAYVDLSGYTEGDHEVEVHVSGDDVKASYISKTDKIKIRISKK